MPTISMFYGILIKMHYREHQPPHIHAEFGEFRASYEIESGKLLAGTLPINKERMVLAWMEIHRDELKANWTLAEAKEALFRIAPLQ